MQFEVLGTVRLRRSGETVELTGRLQLYVHRMRRLLGDPERLTDDPDAAGEQWRLALDINRELQLPEADVVATKLGSVGVVPARRQSLPFRKSLTSVSS